MKYRDAASTPISNSKPRDNFRRVSDAFTTTVALAIVTGIVCFLTETPARAVLLAALAPWGLLALGRLLALASIALEEFLDLIGHPRDINRDGQVGIPITVEEEEPWRQ